MAMAMATATLASSLAPFSNSKHPLFHGYKKPISTYKNTNLSRVSFVVKCQAADPPRVYQGVYGPWSVDPTDVREVTVGHSVHWKCKKLTVGHLVHWERKKLTSVFEAKYRYILRTWATGLGLSLVLIHIYVTEIKRTIQALWVLGVFGSVATEIWLAQPADETLVQYVVDHPTAIWFVGPLFAALTGLVFKEGLCYGKLEAGILTFIIPSLLLGHLSGLMDDGVKVTLLGVWMALFVIFAARKFTQPIKDDIGDKSVFIFKALPEEEKAALIQKLEQQKFSES
ncbi:hypothetical protein OSB04_021990 [Centaurea solstitialis]|uniref:Uncharacterized protein n=1 Tax=Centaurea solstitialis TaxID=347529 RepID=A0AA38TDL8_9ASTR|nr:hypothetical protein OSB04_021990 [Centaurea solstitialis]